MKTVKVKSHKRNGKVVKAHTRKSFNRGGLIRSRSKSEIKDANKQRSDFEKRNKATRDTIDEHADFQKRLEAFRNRR